MDRKADIVCVSSIDWDFIWQGHQEIMSTFAAQGHRVSVVTNLSASPARIEAFLDAAAGRVGVFSASLHLEYVLDIDAFIARAGWVDALVDLYARRRWEFADRDRRDGFSVESSPGAKWRSSAVRGNGTSP